MSKQTKKGYQARTLAGEAWYRFKKNRLAVAAMVLLILMTVVAAATLLIDVVTNESFYDAHVIAQDLTKRLQPPPESTCWAWMSLAATSCCGSFGEPATPCLWGRWPLWARRCWAA